jgi:hypothetical protein
MVNGDVVGGMVKMGANTLGRLVGGIKEVYDVARKDAEIRAQNKRNEWEIPMLNERARREAEEA